MRTPPQRCPASWRCARWRRVRCLGSSQARQALPGGTGTCSVGSQATGDRRQLRAVGTLPNVGGAPPGSRWAGLRQPAVPVPLSLCLAHCLGGGSSAHAALGSLHVVHGSGKAWVAAQALPWHVHSGLLRSSRVINKQFKESNELRHRNCNKYVASCSACPALHRARAGGRNWVTQKL